MTNFRKSILPHVISILAFVLISYAYFPSILENKSLKTGDVVNWQGMAKEIQDYEEETGVESLWTNSMFGGMPAYLILTRTKTNLTKYVHRVLNFLQRPASFVFILLTGFYITLLMFGLSPWIALAGAFAFAFSSYNFIIIEAGHVTKTIAIGYMPPIIGGVYYAFRKNIWVGSAVMGLFLSIQLLVNHLQITYYTFLIILIFGIVELVQVIRAGEHERFMKALGMLIIAALLAVGSNATNILTTYEYGKYSMRGESELTHDEDNKTSGLDKDYATAWSYGIDETMTLLIPNFRGGSSHAELGTNSAVYETLRRQNVPNARRIVEAVPLYFGNQPFTSGPVYVGAVIVFLFVLGLFIVKGPLKWWLASATVISILLAWGNNMMWLTGFFLDYFPGYNKFRTVSMILVMAQFTMPLLGFLAVREMWLRKITAKDAIKYLSYSLYITGGITLLMGLLPGMFGTFSAPSDVQTGWPEWLLESLREDRQSLLRQDAFRSFFFIALTFLLAWLYIRDKIKVHIAITALTTLILVDMWPVNKRYLDESDFVSKREAAEPYTANQADQFILQDTDPNFRVLDLTVSTFNSSRASYFHKSIGGYHGAKMQRYQELIDFYISKEMQQLIRTLQSNPTDSSIRNALDDLEVLNMLNTKYIIVNPEAPPLSNPNALGNAWFVDNVNWVQNADEEIAALGQINPGETTIVDERFSGVLEGVNPAGNAAAEIELTSYAPNHLTYESSSSKEEVAVFSEIYYSKGWQAFIDGEPVPHFRANYVLRGLKVPAGDHTIEFRFEPATYTRGENIALASSILLLLLVMGSLGKELSTFIKKN